MSMAWTAFYWRDYIANTGHLSLQEHGAYLLLMAHYYMTGNPIPANAEQVHRICRCTTDAERAAADSVLAQFFIEQDGEHHHERIDDELKKSNEISEKRANAARMKKQLSSKSSANAGANAEQKHTQPQPQPQEKIEEGDKSPSSARSEKVEFDAHRGKFNNITEQQLDLWRAAYPAVQIETELNKMAAWLVSNPKNRKSNYPKFINNWLSRAQDRAPATGQRGGRQSIHETRAATIAALTGRTNTTGEQGHARVIDITPERAATGSDPVD